MHGKILDFAGALKEAAGLPRSWRRTLMYGVAVVPLAIGVAFVIITLVR